MQVSCWLGLPGQAKYMKILKQELTKMKEIFNFDNEVFLFSLFSL